MRHLRYKLILATLTGLFFLGVFLFTNRVLDSRQSIKCPTIINEQLNVNPVYERQVLEDVSYIDDHKLAVVVPFRNRFNQLLQFVPHMNNFLRKQRINHQILVMNQVDDLRFNRASLINVGFLMAQLLKCDYIAIHDVDLLPLNGNLSYQYPQNSLHHVSSPQLHPKYHYEKFFGGILLVTAKDFISLNGMSNRYWGWGLEDDEFYARVKLQNLKITRPKDVTSGPNDTFVHIHNDKSDKRDSVKLFNQLEVTRKLDRETGLDNVNYKLRSQRELAIDGHSCIVYDIELICDESKTPWCKNAMSEPPKRRVPKRIRSTQASHVHQRPEEDL